MSAVTSEEMEMLQGVRAKADALAHAVHEANAAGFQISFNINPVAGICDTFNVCRMVPIDLRSAAN